MPTNVTVPFFKPGQDVTGYVATAVSGKHFVAPVAGGRGGQPHIAPAAAGSYPLGVAGHDQTVGMYVHVNVGGVVPVIAGADVVAGSPLVVRAGGTVGPRDTATGAPADQPIVGVALASGTSGTAVPVKLNL